MVKTTKQTFGMGYEVTGSEESALLEEAEKHLWETRQKLFAIQRKIKTEKEQSEVEKLAEEYRKVFAEHYDYLRHFVFNNANSLVAYLALYQMIDDENFVFGGVNDDRYVRAVAQKIKTERPNSKYLPLLMSELEKRTTQKRNLCIAQMVQSSKNSYPEIALENAEGKEVSLRGLKAKYALLYFGVLNEDSKKSLQPIYNKYRNRGLEIYFVDENPNIGVWKQAVSDLQTPWVNVHDSRGLGARIYNVQGVPANYIIEVEGTIEGKDLFGRYLTEKLDKLL